jgi:hypothetical protein
MLCGWSAVQRTQKITSPPFFRANLHSSRETSMINRKPPSLTFIGVAAAAPLAALTAREACGHVECFPDIEPLTPYQTRLPPRP